MDEIDYDELTLFFLSLNVNMLTFCFWGWWGLLLCNCNNRGGKGITKLDCSYVPRVERPTWPAETCGICRVCATCFVHLALYFCISQVCTYFSSVFINCISEVHSQVYFSTVLLDCISQVYFSIAFMKCISQVYFSTG